MKNKNKNIIFLDLDGVLNSSFYFSNRERKNDLNKMDYYLHQLDPEALKVFNELCVDVDADVVLSASIRKGKTLEQIQEIFKYCGATFNIIGLTPILSESYVRGNEIYKWIHENITKPYEFHNYVILDDESDMLLCQARNFFQTDNYFGLSPVTAYKICLFFKQYQ